MLNLVSLECTFCNLKTPIFRIEIGRLYYKMGGQKITTLVGIHKYYEMGNPLTMIRFMGQNTQPLPFCVFVKKLTYNLKANVQEDITKIVWLCNMQQILASISR